jgi:predicted nucleic acid-binding protein
MGLVDALVIAAAERLGARAVATLDTRHFAAVKIRGAPQLYPRDL